MKANLRVITVLACAVLVGSCVAQGRGGRQGRGGGPVTLASLLRRSDVQAELKITDEEKTKIDALPRPGRGGGGGGGGAPGGGGGGARTFDPAAAQARAEEEKKAIEAILTPEQFTRLGQLLIQREGPTAVQHADVQASLGLNDDQKSKIKDLFDKYRQANRDLRQKRREMDPQEYQDDVAKNAKALVDELAKVLTSEQADKLKAMGGAPFTFAPGNGG